MAFALLCDLASLREAGFEVCVLGLWQAKARLQRTDGIMLPDGKRENVTGRLLIPELSEPKQQPEQTDVEYELALQKYRDQLNHIDPKVPGWAYTTN